MGNLIIENHKITTPIPEILKQLKAELTNGKLRDIFSSGTSVRVSCPFHKDGLEQHASCGIYQGDSPEIEYGAFHCFTCGKSGPLYHLIAACFNQDDAFGQSWLLERFGNIYIEQLPTLPPIELNRARSAQSRRIQHLDEALLETFQEYHPYMEVRKLLPEVCKKFKVKYDPQTTSLIFPVWDDSGKLYMLTRRSVYNKTFIIDTDKEKPIYLLNFIKEKQIPFVIVCESQINALTCFSYGLPAVATFGCNITQLQFELLNRSGIGHYILAFDGDEAGRRGVERFLKHIRKDIFIDILQLPEGKDINDLNKEEFIALFNSTSLNYLTLQNIYFTKIGALNE